MAMAARQIRVEYVYDEEAGLTVAEQGLIQLGRDGDWGWLVHAIGALSDDDILYRHVPWPGLAGPEGVWGTIALGPYYILCQLYVPASHERALGEQAVLKVDLAGHEDDIHRRIRELGG
jgi:hypothetical protein